MGQGQTYNERVAANIKNDPVGAALLGAMSMAYGGALPGSVPAWNIVLTGGALGSSVNAGTQYIVGGQVNWADAGMAGVTGAMTAGGALWPGVVINTFVGFGVGSKVEGGLTSRINPQSGLIWGWECPVTPPQAICLGS